MENNTPVEFSLQDRRMALAEAIAEGIAYLGEKGLLPLKDEPPVPVTESLQKPNKRK